MNSFIQLKKATPAFLVAVVLACFALSSIAQAQLPPPPPDGGYPNGNTAEGDGALFNLTTGFDNTAIGSGALSSNTTGSNNTANGLDALFSNTMGMDNTAIGEEALAVNTTGSANTATGFGALFGNTTGVNNTATGATALQNNATGSSNTADGQSALSSNTIGHDNTATGFDALFSNTTGSNNTAEGFEALINNRTGSNNIGLGNSAGQHITTGSNNIDIGNVGVAGESNHIRIGTENTQTATFIAGIFRATASGGVAVFVNSSGQLGTLTSSVRFKDEIRPIGKASEAILALKPVAFRYKKDVDPDRPLQFGLVAEDVEKVNPDLVARDEQGKPYTVRYDAVNAMLLNEFLKEHKTVQEQGATIVRQQKQIEALSAGLQKVSAQLEMSKPAPQTVLNNR